MKWRIIAVALWDKGAQAEESDRRQSDLRRGKEFGSNGWKQLADVVFSLSAQFDAIGRIVVGFLWKVDTVAEDKAKDGANWRNNRSKRFEIWGQGLLWEERIWIISLVTDFSYLKIPIVYLWVYLNLSILLAYTDWQGTDLASHMVRGPANLKSIFTRGWMFNFFPTHQVYSLMIMAFNGQRDGYAELTQIPSTPLVYHKAISPQNCWRGRLQPFFEVSILLDIAPTFPFKKSRVWLGAQALHCEWSTNISLESGWW